MQRKISNGNLVYGWSEYFKNQKPPQSPDLNPNRAPLGCGGTGDSHHGCAADKSAATAWRYHVNMDQNLWGMFPKTLLNLFHEELRQFWREKGFQPGTSKVYLIKWPVRIYILTAQFSIPQTVNKHILPTNIQYLPIYIYIYILVTLSIRFNLLTLVNYIS